MEIKKGSIVRSGAGHDKNRFMLVLDVTNGFALLADGKERKLEKPKRKNLKHIFPTGELVDLNGITDAYIRKRLWTYNYGKYS